MLKEKYINCAGRHGGKENTGGMGKTILVIVPKKGNLKNHTTKMLMMVRQERPNAQTDTL